MPLPRRSLAAAALVLVLAGGSLFWLRRPASPLGPELATPALALAYLEKVAPAQGKKLFFTPAALEFLPGDREALRKQAGEFDAAAQKPQAWRTLDRKERFDALLLTGSPAAFRPLLDHLRQSPDWTLVDLDPTSLIFRRSPATAWSPKDLEPLKAAFASRPKREQVLMRVQSADRLVAIGEPGPARELLDEAIKIDPSSSPAWTELACLHAAQGQWEKALETSERAVQCDKGYLPALAAKANALFAYGKFNEALALTRQLIEKEPGDGPNLYLHAKVTHAAHAYAEEIETLLKIISVAEARSMPTGTWRIFLAQAYGATGQAEPALAQFEAALKESTLSEKERAFAEKAIERIKSREPIL